MSCVRDGDCSVCSLKSRDTGKSLQSLRYASVIHLLMKLVCNLSENSRDERGRK